ncbi:MAG: hypothetical protein JWN65_106 [Solirubrobacterales bacterium]|nr:hypothetical protein [Solirubrobacterales bacterium]
MFRKTFAILTAVVTAVVAAVVLWKPASAVWKVTKADWVADQGGDTALAASLGVPLVVMGGVLVALGAWMALVEWRGRFVDPERARAGVTAAPTIDVPAMITAIGKLRGAALVMVVGALLMFGAAWVGQSSAGSPDTATAPATSAATTAPAAPTTPATPTTPVPPTPTSP